MVQVSCQHERQVLITTELGRGWVTGVCGIPTAPGDAWCQDHGADCKTCGERFHCDDPSDPGVRECPDCAAETGRFIAEQRKATPEYGKDV